MGIAILEIRMMSRYGHLKLDPWQLSVDLSAEGQSNEAELQIVA